MFATEVVREVNYAFGHRESDRRLPAALLAGVIYRGESAAARSGVDRRAVLGVGGAGGGFDLAPTTDAGVGVSTTDQRLYGVGVESHPRRLVDRAFVPVEAEPAQVLHGLPVRALLDPRPVQVFHAQQDSPAGTAGEEPVDQEGAGVPEVQRAGGRGGKAGNLHSISTKRYEDCNCRVEWLTLYFPR